MLLSFLLNLIFNWEFLLIAVIALLLHFWLGLTIWAFIILLIIWLLVALGITLVLKWASSSSSTPPPEKKNVNPYSKKTKDFIKDIYNDKNK